MVYPTLLAAIGDVAHPAWRARAVGVYRLWRDGGFAVGAVLAGLLADAFGMRLAIWAIAALTLASGLVVALRMYETMRPTARSGRRGGETADGRGSTAHTPRGIVVDMSSHHEIRARLAARATA